MLPTLSIFSVYLNVVFNINIILKLHIISLAHFKGRKISYKKPPSNKTQRKFSFNPF